MEHANVKAINPGMFSQEFFVKIWILERLCEAVSRQEPPQKVSIVSKGDDIAMRWKANRVCCCVALQKRNREGHTTVRFPVKGNSVGA